MTKLKVLQCGFPKSGNYGVFKVLQAILAQNGLFASFKKSVGLDQIIDSLCLDFKIFPEINILDSFWQGPQGFHLAFPHPQRRFIALAPEVLVSASSLLWTHEKADIIAQPALKPVTHWLYVLRDGRDALNSMVHHVVRAEVLRLRPEYRHRQVKDVYSDLPLLKKWAEEWRAHVASYQKHCSKFICLRLEELIASPSKFIRGLVQNLGLEVDVAQILDRVSFARLSRAAPSHLRQGRAGEWRDHFTPQHKEIFKESAGAELIALGYEKDNDW